MAIQEDEVLYVSVGCMSSSAKAKATYGDFYYIAR